MSMNQKSPNAADTPYSRRPLLEAASNWRTSNKYHEDGLISWRNYVSFALRTVSRNDVGDGLVRVIESMDDLTTARILELHEDEPAALADFGFPEWLPHWQAHFGHWVDPVREMLGTLCITPEARFFANRLHACDGEVLLDFLLGTCCSRLEYLLDPKQQPRAIVPPFPLALDFMAKERMIEQLCRKVYDRFREIAPFPTQAAPDQLDLGLDYDRLCPREPQNHPENQSSGEAG